MHATHTSADTSSSSHLEHQGKRVRCTASDVLASHKQMNILVSVGSGYDSDFCDSCPLVAAILLANLQCLSCLGFAANLC